jgi:hypothetical protein
MNDGWGLFFLGLMILAMTFGLARMRLSYWAAGIENKRFKKNVRAFCLPWFGLFGFICIFAGIARVVGWRR